MPVEYGIYGAVGLEGAWEKGRQMLYNTCYMDAGETVLYGLSIINC